MEIESLYSKAKFNEEAKFELLRIVSMKVPEFYSFAIKRCATK